MFYWRMSAQRSGNRLKNYSRRNTLTFVYPPVENLTIAYFNEYEELQETVLLDLS